MHYYIDTRILCITEHHNMIIPRSILCTINYLSKVSIRFAYFLSRIVLEAVRILILVVLDAEFRMMEFLEGGIIKQKLEDSIEILIFPLCK